MAKKSTAKKVKKVEKVIPVKKEKKPVETYTEKTISRRGRTIVYKLYPDGRTEEIE